MSTYSDKTEYAKWKPLMLVEIEPSKRLDSEGWTQDGVYTNCWYTSWIEPEPSKVRENSSYYTERANLSNCNSNASSYYYDSSNDRLYVHTSGSDDPSGGTYIIQSYFWEYHCDSTYREPLVYNSNLYIPDLNADSVPNVTRGVSGLTGGELTESVGTIKIINGIADGSANGRWDTRLTTYNYQPRRIRAYYGWYGIAYTDMITIFNGWTGNIRWNDREVEFDYMDLRRHSPSA